MFLFFLIFAISVFAWKVWESYPALSDQIQQAIEIHTSPTAIPEERCKEVSLQLETPWVPWYPDVSDAALSKTCIRQIGKQSRFFGTIEIKIEGDHIQIFDWMFHLPIGNTAKEYFQTVVIIRPDTLKLPPFFLQPGSHNLHRQVSEASRVKTETALDLTYEIESLVPFRLKSLFQSEIGQNELIPFLIGQAWTIQWTGDRMIVYTLNHLVPAAQIQHFALEVTDFFHLLKSAPDEIDRHMNNFINQALSEMPTR